MLEFLEKYSGNLWCSQNGEECLELEIMRRLDIKAGRCFEAGAADGLWCSNTALLIRDYGWSGLMVESDYDLYLKCCETWKRNPRVECKHLMVEESNINSLVDESCDLLSLDTDGPDYFLFKALKARPKIVIIEIDSSIPTDNGGFSAVGGAGYLAMAMLAIEKQYFVLAHPGNLVLLREEFHPLFPEIDVNPIEHPERYFNNAVLTGDRTWLNR